MTDCWLPAALPLLPYLLHLANCFPHGPCSDEEAGEEAVSRLNVAVQPAAPPTSQSLLLARLTSWGVAHGVQLSAMQQGLRPVPEDSQGELEQARGS